MDTLRKIQSLRSDPAPQSHSPRLASMQHIHGVLNEAGPRTELTVGDAVAAAIEGIRYGAGEHGSRRVDRVFRDRSLDNAYRTPLNSPNAAMAHRQVATAEFNYWAREGAQQRSAATDAALSFSIDQRVQLQQSIGQMVQMGSSFTQSLEQQQTFSTSNNPVAQYANMHLPRGSTRSSSPSASASSAARPAQTHQNSSNSGRGRGRGSGSR